MQGSLTAVLALTLVIGFAGCSGVNLMRDPSMAENASADDAKCISEGWRSNSPEYAQCRNNLKAERTIAEANAMRMAYPGIAP